MGNKFRRIGGASMNTSKLKDKLLLTYAHLLLLLIGLDILGLLIYFIFFY